MERENRDDRLAAVEDEFAGYTVYDEHYEKIGKVDDLFVDENDRPEYLGVKMGLLGLKSTLIPWELARVNEKRQLIEVGAPKDQIKDAPTFDDDEEISPELEERVYRHFRLQHGSAERSGYGAYYRDEDYSSSPAATGGVTDEERRSEDHYGERRSDDVATGGVERERGEYRDRPDQDRPASPDRAGAAARDARDTRGARGGDVADEDELRERRSDDVTTGGVERERGENRDRPDQDRLDRDRPASSDRAGAAARDTRGARGGDVANEDEMRVQRSEEELRVGTREHEAGSVNVRKRVRTEREQVRVPRKREEVHVERVPVEGRERASEDEIGDDEIRVPVIEEEIVVEKRPVVKEELRIRKDVVEDEEIVEEDVRKEEVEIDDETTGRGGRPEDTAGRGGRSGETAGRGERPGERPGGTARRDNDDLEDERRRRDR